MRAPTPADGRLLLHLYDVRREPELRKARAWFLTQFKPDSWAEIKSRYLSHEDEDRWFRMTTSYWEMVGTLVNRGALNAELYFDHTGEDIVTWERCKPWIAEARADLRPTYLYQLERLVVAHQEFRVKTIAAYRAEQSKAVANAARKASSARRSSGRAKRSR